MLTTIALIFAGSALAVGGAFLASYAAENGLPFDLAALQPAPALRTALAPASIPAGPVWCETARRWRDPVTLRFVKAPR